MADPMRVVLALGLVLTVEGLLLALAPRRVLELLEWLAQASRDQRRGLGLLGLALGVVLIWLAERYGT